MIICIFFLAFCKINLMIMLLENRVGFLVVFSEFKDLVFELFLYRRFIFLQISYTLIDFNPLLFHFFVVFINFAWTSFEILIDFEIFSNFFFVIFYNLLLVAVCFVCFIHDRFDFFVKWGQNFFKYFFRVYKFFYLLFIILCNCSQSFFVFHFF